VLAADGRKRPFPNKIEVERGGMAERSMPVVLKTTPSGEFP
jgi:hypothetical protein